MLASHPNFQSLALGGAWPEIARAAEALVGLPRNLSLHPGGVVIVPDVLTNYVPVEFAAKQIDTGEGVLAVPTIQFEKDGTEDAGLVKIDLLGNRSLAVIRDAIAAVREHEDVAIDYTTSAPVADEATRRVFRTGDTMGVFYTESPASRLLCQKSKSDTFDLLVLNTSIIRPASNRYINTYLERLHGASWEPPHPVLRDVLAETFGVMVYQEDVVNVCVALAGMDVAEADGVRKALTKKRPMKELRAYEEQFRAGAAARGVAPTGRGRGVVDDPLVLRLLVLQGSLGVLHPGGAAVGLPTGTSPRGVHRGRAVERGRLLRPLRLHRRGAAHEARDPAARRQRE